MQLRTAEETFGLLFFLSVWVVFYDLKTYLTDFFLYFCKYLVIKKNNDMMKKQYEAPELEQMEISVEAGFATSGSAPDSDDTEFGYDNN